MPALTSAVHRYHDGTKHHFHQFARSLGYLDWASQPHPFRRFAGAPRFPLFPSPQAPRHEYVPRSISYQQLIDGHGTPPASRTPLSAGAIGDLLRYSLGLSAWKEFRSSRWSLRVNPSSGNLHPTEAYVICGPCEGLAQSPSVYHYAADEHALEERCAFDPRAWASACDGETDVVLVALTSIHWREAWKYGERAFRYCQHDLGHATAAVAIAAAAVGWRAVMLSAWSHRAIAAITGSDRDTDFVEAEREEPGCLIAISSGRVPDPIWNGGADLVRSVAAGRWTGRANQLSEDHVQWTFIDEIARATVDEGRPPPPALDLRQAQVDPEQRRRVASAAGLEDSLLARAAGATHANSPDARALILQRRSALGFDGRSPLSRGAFFSMLARVLPGPRPPFDIVWWTPRLHLAIFVHRVDDLEPGVYLLPRDPTALGRLRAACGREFLWENADADVPLMLLARGDCRRLAERLSCDQEIAADGFFSLGMIAEFDASLDAYGSSFYRHLFWESGVIGQMLYLEAEAAGARATGIGCFYDDPVHDVLGLRDHAFQSLYHFTIGVHVEDARLTSEPGYGWEK